MGRLERARRNARGLLRAEGAAEAPVDVYAIARRHAIVVEMTMNDNISGMLIPLEKPIQKRMWAIVVNESHPEVRQRFTVAHELGHLRLHRFSTPHADRGFKARFRSIRSSDGTVAEEIEANQFAAELLMPADLLISELKDVDVDFVPEHEQTVDRVLDAIARKFCVSRQALDIRMSNLFW